MKRRSAKGAFRSISSSRPTLGVSRLRAFTLTELMVAVAVLIVVIIATSKIFGTASKITGIGQGTAAMITEAAAIEQQIRDDIAKLTSEGFLAIHCVAVRNDVNQVGPPVNPGAPLLNPNLPSNAVIRADQLVFFANGVESMQTFRAGYGSLHRAQASVSRIYYGHAFQIPEGLAAQPQGSNMLARDPFVPVANPNLTSPNMMNTLRPWYFGSWNLVNTLFLSSAGPTEYATPSTAATGFNAGQPQSSQWLLARQNVLLGDDGGEPTVFLDEIRSADSIVHAVVRNGRVDVAAQQLNDLRKSVTIINQATGAPRPWDGGLVSQRTVIKTAVFYPRAEREAPSSHRVDHALTNHVISSGCSSFSIDWTYYGANGQRVDANGNFIGGVGEVLDPLGKVVDPTPASPNSGDEMTGVIIFSDIEQPWFGLRPDFDGNGLADDGRGIYHYHMLLATPVTGGRKLWAANTILPLNTFPNNIESSSISTATIQDYWTLFGYNQTVPLNKNPSSALYNLPDPALGYTPFPSALRITMTLHDPEGKLEAGREFQFVIELPKRH